MSRIMWIGTRGNLLKVKAPQPGTGMSPVGYMESVQYLSGRKGVRASFGSHMEYDLTLKGTRDELEPLIDLAAGYYGPGPFYVVDPVWAARNALPAHWANPSLGGMDAPVIYGTARPTLSTGPASGLGVPAQVATFTNQPGSPQREVYIPIPEGHTARFSFVGTSGSIRLQPMNGEATSGSELTPASTPVGGTSILETAIAHSGTVTGVVVRVHPTASFQLRALQLRLTKDSTPVTRFSGGRGHTALRFEGHPTVTPYSVPYDSIGLTARLVEVDA